MDFMGIAGVAGITIICYLAALDDHDSYYVIPSNIHTKAGNIYSLVLFYEPSSISSLSVSYTHLTTITHFPNS